MTDDIDERIKPLETDVQPTAGDLRAAPVVDFWRLFQYRREDGARCYGVDGVVSGSGQFEDAHRIRTSAIATIDRSRRWVRTQNTLYRLGAPQGEERLVVAVVTAADWIEGWKIAVETVGRHTVADWVWRAANAAADEEAPWPSRRSAALAVGHVLAQQGRVPVARVWWILGADGADKWQCGTAHEIIEGSLAGAKQPTARQQTVLAGWKMLGIGDNMGEDVSDPIAAAPRIGALAEAIPPAPLLLRMAACADWPSAAKLFRADWNAKAPNHEKLEMKEFLAASPNERRLMASNWVSVLPGWAQQFKNCLLLLATDVRDALAMRFIHKEIEAAARSHGGDFAATDKVWGAMCEGRQIGGTVQGDPFAAAAWPQANRIDNSRLFASSDALRESKVEIGKEDAPPDDGPGVVVLAAVGGTKETSSGKEVAREFKAIVGKRLPVAVAKDLAGVRTKLHAEFPHLAAQVDVLLSDLTEGAELRCRPTLFVGTPGSGKSRLCRRWAECLALPLHRFDGAGSSDNAFGGTPRRWSSGEHAFPLEAVRRSGIANPLVMIDEIDKAGTSRHNGSLAAALLPFIDGETSRRFADPFIQSECDLSHVGYVLTANDDTVLPAPLRDRFRVVRLPEPGADHAAAIARTVVADIAKERGGDPRFFPDLDDGELAVVEGLWPGGSVRRLRAIVERILAYREQRPRQ